METCDAVLTDPVMYLEIYKAKINKRANVLTFREFIVITRAMATRTSRQTTSSHYL